MKNPVKRVIVFFRSSITGRFITRKRAEQDISRSQRETRK